MNDFLKTIAPTLASALLGPLGGAAVAAIGNIMGIDQPTQAKIADAIKGQSLAPEQLSEIQKLELQYQENERERGFRYAELAFKDRDSARRSAVDGGMLGYLFALSVGLLLLTLGTEIYVLKWGYPDDLPEMIVGRVLGLMDAIAMMVLSFWYGTSHGSQNKDVLLAQSQPAGK